MAAADLQRAVERVHLVAALYVLKSHVNWSHAPPNRRGRQPARPLAELTGQLTVDAFDLSDLVAPGVEDEHAKRAAAENDLKLVSRFAQRCDAAITPELRAVAKNKATATWTGKSHADWTTSADASRRSVKARRPAGCCSAGPDRPSGPERRRIFSPRGPFQGGRVPRCAHRIWGTDCRRGERVGPASRLRGLLTCDVG